MSGSPNAHCTTPAHTEPDAPSVSRSRITRRGLAIGALVLSGLVATPTAMAQGDIVTLTGPIPAGTAQVPATTELAAAVATTAVVPAAVPAIVTPEAALATKRTAFLRFTTTSPEATDRRGVEPSLYRGKYFRASLERVRRCIVQRESSGVYTVRGGGGDRYYGAYQMNDDLADGATWMMLPEAKQLLGETAARDLMARLRAKPVTTWSRYWQDAAFFTIYNWERTGSGRAHWAGGRWRC